jgi:hypothetical protein
MLKGLLYAGKTGLLLIPLLAPLLVRAEWKIPGFDGQKLTPAGMDRAFECKVQRLLDERYGGAGDVLIEVSRFGNAIVITGEVADTASRKQVDQLVLDAAGIARKEADSVTAIPANTRACDGKPLLANTKRKSIVKTSKDCSSLRPGEPQTDSKQTALQGQVFNHLAVASDRPARQHAESELLTARARVALIDAGVGSSVDSSVMKLVAQDGTLFVLGNLDAAMQAEIKTVLMGLPGVRHTQFYIE